MPTSVKSNRYGLGTEEKKFRKSDFIDLRDRSGLLQIVFDEESVGAEGFAKAGTLRSEYVVAVEGTVQKRSAAVNENLKTGDIEVIATSLRILSESQTPPFAIEENSQTKEDIRLKYRYLDLRRPDIQKNLMLKSRVLGLMRQFMAMRDFRDRDSDPVQVYTGRCQRLSCAKPCASGKFLCTATVSAAVQAASDGIRL